MFAGIIEHCGTITELIKNPHSLRLGIRCDYTDIAEGESIAVDGICLTAVMPQKNLFYCDISPETLSCTSAQHFKIGGSVNLERALRLGDRIGGHWVTGHVDQTAQIAQHKAHADFSEYDITGIEPSSMPLLTDKGSIAVNGVSLTVNKVLPNGFQIMLIPHTLAMTNLKDLSPGSTINLEFDWMTKVIINQLRTQTSIIK